LNPESIIRKIDATLESIIKEDLKILKDIKEYIIRSGGKRIRPFLHLIFTEILGYKKKDRWIVASITELIHAASLLHDDVVDLAETRRGIQTVGSKFGNKTAILSGDYLLACGISALNRLHSPILMDIFTEVIRDLSVSELLQMEWERNPKITPDIYKRIVYGKTGSLFAASVESAGILGGMNRKSSLKIREFGIQLGRIFQIRDDFLDYFSPQSESGKDSLKDFRNKLYTYPLLVLRESADSSDRRLIPEIVDSSDEKKILSLMKAYKVDDRIRKELQSEIDSLQKFVCRYSDSPPRRLLQDQLQKLYV